MTERLPESERRQLRDIENRLARIASFLQEMTGTVQSIAWGIEDALWNNESPDKLRLRDDITIHAGDAHELICQTRGLIAAVDKYSHGDEHQAALNALHNAGLLPPQEEPPDMGQQGQ